MRPVTVGIIGAGNVIWAYFQVLDRLLPRGLARMGPVCARRQETWQDFQTRRPGIQLVANPAEVLQSDVDVVLIITPPESHSSLVRLALEHGKHVVVEKPSAATRCEAQQLAMQAQERGLGSVGPLAEVGIYNLKSLTAVLGPVAEVQSAETLVVPDREISGKTVRTAGADVSHVLLRHADGGLSSVISGHCIQRYRRPGLEFYGTEGTANLLGDDWDPRGFEIWRNSAGCWEEFEPVDPTWLWADGLAEMVHALTEERQPLHSLEHDLHLLEVIEASTKAAKEKRAVAVQSRFRTLDLRMEERQNRHHLHDHTRPADEQ